MKRLPALAFVTLLASAAPIAAHAQDAAALCKIIAAQSGKQGANEVTRIPVPADLASQVQGVQPGSLVEVHSDGRITAGGQDISKQAQGVCANPSVMTKDQQPQNEAHASDASAGDSNIGNIVPKHTHTRHHGATASTNGVAPASPPVETEGDHYTPPPTSSSQTLGTLTNGGAPAGGVNGGPASPGGMPSSGVTSGAMGGGTGSSGTLAPSSPQSAGGTNTGSSAYTPAAPGSLAPSTAANSSAPYGSPVSPATTSPGAPPGVMAPDHQTDLTAPAPSSMSHSGSDSSPQGPISSSSSGSSSGSSSSSGH